MKRRLSLTLSLVLFLQASYLLAQTPETFFEFSCPTAQANAALLTEDKNYAKETEAFEQFYQTYAQEVTNRATKSNVVYTIPTVVHIVHSCAGLGTINNPSDEQITAIMEEVNERFRQTHESSKSYSNPNYGADSEIELCLANVDPDGNYTTGILHHADGENHIGDYFQLRNAYAVNYRWDRTKYYNIFIATNLTDAGGVFVGGSGADFVIIDAVGFNPSLICHETGHYFSLRHTFQSGCGNSNCLASGDFVCDTPPKSSTGYGGGTCNAPSNSCSDDEHDTATYNPYRSVSIGGMGDQVDMFENYMDYTSDCWDAFTEGQKVRMHANIEASRMSQVAHAAIACGTVVAITNDVAIQKVTASVINCAGSFTPSVEFQNRGTNTLTSTTIRVTNANTTKTLNWTGNLAPGASTSVGFSSISLVAGVNTITATASTPNGNSDGFNDNNSACTTVAFPSATGLDLPFEDDFSACAPNPFYYYENDDEVNWSISNYSNPAGLSDCQDCFARVLGFATPAGDAQICLPKLDFSTASAPKIQFNLGHIPRYAFITNTLRMKVSSDCGTATTVWEASALELATNTSGDYSNGVYLYPNCSEMLTFEVDLSAFANSTNVEICFEAAGRWYSPLIIDDIKVDDIATKKLALKTMLSGPYDTNTGLMDAQLRTLNNFPLSEPYSKMGYTFAGNGGGETIDESVLYPNDENAIVDWIIVEIRDPNTPTTVVSSRAALIQSDGDIVDTDGISALDITNVVSGDYYIAIRHRNHLGAMSLVTID